MKTSILRKKFKLSHNNQLTKIPRKGKRNSSLGNRRPSKHLKCTSNLNQVRNEDLKQEVGRPKKAESDKLSSLSSSSNINFRIAELIMDDMHSVETTYTEKEADNIKRKLLDASARQYTVAYLFAKKQQGLKKLGKGRFTEKCNKKNGMISKIRKDLGCWKNFRFSSIENVLLEVVLCYTNGTKFDLQATRQKGERRPPTFSLDSAEAEIVADSMEEGLPRNTLLFLLNEHLKEDMEDNNELACLSSNISVVKRLNLQLKRV